MTNRDLVTAAKIPPSGAVFIFTDGFGSQSNTTQLSFVVTVIPKNQLDPFTRLATIHHHILRCTDTKADT